MTNFSQVAYGYLRVSTSEQGETGLGLDVQEDQIRNYCGQNQINLLKIFKDPGHSGADANRPGLQQMITLAKENKISLILIAHSSRLARDSMLAEIIYRDLRKHGITLISVSQANYYEQDGDFQRKLARTIFDAFDEYEKSLISWRLKNGRSKRAELGGWHGGWVYGYNHGKNGRLIINVKEAEVVKRIFYFKRYKKWSAGGIAEILNQENVPTKRKNTKWHSLTIKKILENPIYRGRIRYQGKIYNGKHESIIK